MATWNDYLKAFFHNNPISNRFATTFYNISNKVQRMLHILRGDFNELRQSCVNNEHCRKYTRKTHC